jgi:heat shock protein HtpX
VAEYFIRVSFGCREATSDEAEIVGSALQRVWDRTKDAQAAGNSFLSIGPMVYVTNSKYPNAYAIGLHSVVVTTGLLGIASDEELDGLLAHEISHIVHRDTIKRTAAYTLNTVGNIASWIMVGILALWGLLGEIVGGEGFVALIVGIIALVFKWALNGVQKLLELGLLSVGRSEEYRADAYAKSLGFGPGLVSFLSRMQYIEKAPEGLWAALSRTHPPTAERIRKLEMS